MTVIKSFALFLVLFITAIAAQDCRVSIQQQLRTSWADTNLGVQYSLYDVFIQNSGSVDVGSLTFTIGSPVVNFWELASLGDNLYSLPQWRSNLGGIPVAASHQFGYIIQSDAPAEFTIVSCGGEPTPVENPTGSPTDAPATPTDAPATATDAPVPATDAPAPATDAPAPATDAPTDAPAPATDAPTDAPAPATDAPTDAPAPATDAPTDAPAPATDAPSGRPTSAPTGEPTKRPTRRPATSAPTSEPTSAPTAKQATSAPTSKQATAAPTTKQATAAPSSASTTKQATTAPSAGGRICPSGTWWKPAPLTTYQWQISGNLDTSVNVQMYDIDLFGTTAAQIKTLHNAGRVVICYFSSQYEDWRPDAKSFPASVLGNDLDDWEGEKYVDIRSSTVRSLMTARLDLAASKGCDGVEPDNVDGYTANTGFPLKAADQLDYNKFLAAESHKRGLSVGLKNDLGHASVLEPFFDWALNEQCYQYSECDDLTVFVNAGKAVFNTEYSGTESKICSSMNSMKITSLIKSLSLDASIKAQCCTSLPGGCAPAPYTCVSSSSSLLAADEPKVYAAPEQIVEHFDSSAVTLSSMFTHYPTTSFFLAVVVCGVMLA